VSPGAGALRNGRRSGDLRDYALVTGAYWADTVADGAIRMLVLFYFIQQDSARSRWRCCSSL